MPFYFAQEQAMKRVGRLVTSDPQAFRDFQMINQGLNNPGFVHTDANGKKYIVYPMAGEFGNSLTRGLSALGITPSFGLPTSVTGTTNSLATVLPEVKVPSISTFGNIALEQLSKHFPVFTGLANVASGGFPPTTLKEAILPNSAMRDIFDAMTMDQTQSNVYNSIHSAIAAAYYHGDLVDGFTSLPPAEQQAVMDKIENNARSNLLVKGLLAFFLPLSPNVTNDYYTKDLQSFRSEYLNLLNTKDPVTKQNYTLAAALAKFQAEHGSRAVSYTVGSTTDLMNGANPSLSAATSAWMDNNKDLLTGPYGNAAGYLMPQGTSGGNISKLENRMLQLGLRARKTPQEFLNSVYVSSGWSDVNDVYQGYLQYVKDARNSGNTQAVSQATAAWNAYAQNYAASNPIWFEDYSSISRVINADKVLSSFEALQKDGKMPNDAQGQGIVSLLNDYNAFKPMLAATTINNKTNTAQRSQLLNVWSAYLDSVAAEQPNLVNVINGVFRRVTAKL
jgi:hypothetical protein